MRKTTGSRAAQGFSLLEVLVAMLVLVVGVLGLAATFAAGLTYIYSSQNDFIAQQKASETAESIFTARDSSALSWPQIQNVSNGGVFLDGPQELCDPGLDGIVGTADDNCLLPDSIVTPGPDGILGTADDVKMPLWSFRRTIAITPDPLNPGLRDIKITITYKAGRLNRQYVLQTEISSSF